MAFEDRDYNREGGDGIPPVRFSLPGLTPFIWTLLGVNLGLFLFKINEDVYAHLLYWGALTLKAPYGHWWQLWRLVSYQYLHESAGHIFFNLIGIYFFVSPLERRWGWRKTFAFYTMGGIFAGLCFVALASVTSGLAFLIGASGAIFAAMGAVALLYPDMQLILLVFFVPIRVAAALFALFFLLTTVADHDYSNAAHLGGLVFGFCAPWIIGPMLAQQQFKLQQWQGQRMRDAEINEQREIDRILAKVGESGMNSLTGGEKKTLAKASQNQQKRDAARRR